MTRRPHDLLPGDRVGSLRVVEEIGRGAFGAVYRAHDEVIGRDVALKVVGGLDLDDKRWALIEREIKVLGRLAHPNIVTLHHIHVDGDGRRMLEMELVEGMDLEERLELEGPLRAEELKAIVTALCGALGTAHAQGIVHRDVKPANVLLGVGGEVKLADFGLGKDLSEASLEASRDGAVGSPYYMAPEVLRGEAATPASDLWSLGVLIHVAATGERPFDGASLAHVFAAVHGSQPRRLPSTVAVALRDVVAACLVKNPRQRVSSAKELIAALSDPTSASRRRPREGRASVPRLFGREAVCSVVRSHLSDRGSKGFRALALFGQGGCGLSSLLEYAVAEAASNGGDVLQLRISPVGGLFSELRTALGVLRRGQPGDSLEDLLDGLCEWVRAAPTDGPCLLAIDNVQFGNSDDSRLIAQLLHVLSEHPVTVVLARADALVDNSAVVELPQLSSLTSMRVEPLDLVASENIILGYWAPRRVDASILRRMIAGASGSPAALMQLIRHAEAAGEVVITDTEVRKASGSSETVAPAAIEARVLAELRLLSESEIELVEHAAIAGDEFDAKLVASILDRDLLGTLRALQAMTRRATLVVGTRSGFRFTSPLVRETIYERVAPAYRRVLHELYASWLADESSPCAASLEAQARHWLLAGDRRRAADLAARAVIAFPRGDSVRSSALAEATALMSHASQLADAPMAFEAVMRLFSVYVDHGDAESARSCIEALRAISQGADASYKSACVALREYALLKSEIGSHQAPIGGLEAAVQTLAGTDHGRQGLYLLANALSRKCRLSQARRACDALMREAMAAGDRHALGRAMLLDADLAAELLDSKSAMESGQLALETFRELHHPMNEAIASANLGMVLLSRGEKVEAMTRFDAAIRSLRRGGASRILLGAEVAWASLLASAGETEHSQAVLDAWAAAFSSVAPPHVHLQALDTHVMLSRHLENSTSILRRLELWRELAWKHGGAVDRAAVAAEQWARELAASTAEGASVGATLAAVRDSAAETPRSIAELSHRIIEASMRRRSPVPQELGVLGDHPALNEAAKGVGQAVRHMTALAGVSLAVTSSVHRQAGLALATLPLGRDVVGRTWLAECLTATCED